MMAVRERVGEIAVLKTVGYPNAAVFWMVLAESALLTLVGGAIGLGLAVLAFSGSTPLDSFFPGFGVTGDTVALGLAIALVLGLVSGAIPALQSARLSVVSALRRVA
jgi:putative ABC transport system permease protein